MKRRSFISLLLCTAIASGGSLLLSGCTSDDYWPYYPPSGWGGNYFYDSRLNGDWELTSSSIGEVGTRDRNYMEFFGGGHGRYYYFSNGRLESEEMAYFCQEAQGPGSRLYKINIQYEDGSDATMRYSLSNGNTSLMMQWRASGETITYIYSRINTIPW